MSKGHVMLLRTALENSGWSPENAYWRRARWIAPQPHARQLQWRLRCAELSISSGNPGFRAALAARRRAPERHPRVPKRTYSLLSEREHLVARQPRLRERPRFPTALHSLRQEEAICCSEHRLSTHGTGSRSYTEQAWSRCHRNWIHPILSTGRLT